MKTKPTKQKQARNTLGKRLAKLAAPQDRLQAMMDARKPEKYIRPDAEKFVGQWQAVLGLVALGDDDGGHSAKTDEAISDLGHASLDALAVAFEKWDADFFENVAHAMKHAASVGSYDKPRIMVEHSLMTTRKVDAGEIAEQLTAGNSNLDPESVSHAVRRYSRQIRSADK